VFLPRDADAAQAAREVITEALRARANLEVVAWRPVPVDEAILGEAALAGVPTFEQVRAAAAGCPRPRARAHRRSFSPARARPSRPAFSRRRAPASSAPAAPPYAGPRPCEVVIANGPGGELEGDALEVGARGPGSLPCGNVLLLRHGWALPCFLPYIQDAHKIRNPAHKIRF
jgi:hypothetical protein